MNKMANKAIQQTLSTQKDPYIKSKEQPGRLKPRTSPLLDVMRVKEDPNRIKQNPYLFELDLERTDPTSPRYSVDAAAEVRQAQKDSILFSNHLGDLCLTSVYAFPKMYNCLPMNEIRSKYFVIRGIWLGLGSVQRFGEIQRKVSLIQDSERKIDTLDRLISEALIDDLVSMAASYYFDTDITDRAKIKQAEATGKAFQPRNYRAKFEKAFAGSQYTYDLVRALGSLFENPNAELPEIPESINVGYFQSSTNLDEIDQGAAPKWPDSLIITPEELHTTKSRILSGNYKLIGVKEKIETSKTVEDLQKQVALLTKIVAEKAQSTEPTTQPPKIEKE